MNAARAVCAALLAGLAAGCGSEEDATRAVRDAAVRTTTAGPLAIDETAEVTAGRRQRVALAIKGTADGKARTARFTMSSRLEGEGTPSASVREFDELLDGEMAVRGELVYMRLPALDREAGLNGRWLVLDPNDPISKQVGFTGTSGIGGPDPSRPADLLRAAEDVERVGTEGGETHYRLKVDYGRYLDLLPTKERRALAGELRKLRLMVDTSAVEHEVWIDDDGYVTRMQGDLESRFGADVASYSIELSRADRPPAIPRHGVTFDDLANE
jgi:hypothetical protein